MEYHKIESVFKRDPDNKYKTFLEGEWTRPEFWYLSQNIWEFTEKVDGTNIRVYYNAESDPEIQFRGRTNKAQIPPFLEEALNGMFDSAILSTLFGDSSVVLYGEGYGPKIQKGGDRYRDDVSFVLFDVMVNGAYLERHNVEDIAEKLSLDVVPVLFCGTLYEGIEICRKGFTSEWGDFEAEGVVAKPTTELSNRFGNRIITKIKCNDFKNT